MSLRVVLYAEGGGETGGLLRVGRRPGDVLVEESLGAGHRLIRRLITEVRPAMPQGAIIFEEPLGMRGRVPKGSDLAHVESLRLLLTWFQESRRPDLAVVLVDQDGDAGRHSLMIDGTATLPVPVTRVVAVATQEFEAWLIADSSAVRDVLDPDENQPSSTEALSPGQAKEILRRWCGAVSQQKSGDEARLPLADLSDLAVLAARCPSFARFREHLDAAPA